MQDQKPLSVGQVLDRGFNLYRRSLGKLLPLCLMMTLLPLLPRLVYSPQSLVRNGHITGNTGGYFGLALLGGLISLVLMIAVIRKLDDVDSGRNQLGIAEVLASSVRYLLPLLGAAIVCSFMIVIGLLLLLVPGIILSVSLMLAPYPLLLEDAGISDSIKLSRSLVKGHWWHTATVVGVTSLIYAAVYAAVFASAALVLPASNVLSAVSGQSAPNTLGLLLFAIASAAAQSLLTPAMYSVFLVTFRDLQLRRSGADLAARIAAAA